MNTLLKDGYSGIGADAALNLPLQALTGVSDEIAKWKRLWICLKNGELPGSR